MDWVRKEGRVAARGKRRLKGVGRHNYRKASAKLKGKDYKRICDWRKNPPLAYDDVSGPGEK